MIWELFFTFFKIGFISFGGGYTVIPTIQNKVVAYGWMTGAEFQKAVSVAGMAPGPIATNAVTLIGYDTAGIPGAIAACAGIVLPSLIVVIALAAFFFPYQSNKTSKSIFYGLRPVVTGLIAYAAIHFANFDKLSGYTWMNGFTLLICAGCLVLLAKYKLHPLTVIAAAGAAGIVFL
ncbi:chromate transporter [Paenibacillus glycanilyticus]|uniref:Chromate transporter n=1 Tax=Paenibacillus glycanilyticus TaxID=126569 RepID=A0ABQ6GMU0_9BACL|nr:chromate transporter [Paenibacillus glycanilyticus]GLX70342.1 chromate transporter [Paenibacillus glycanilyticus]